MIKFILALVLTTTCYYNQQVPRVFRPDTRRIGFIHLDTTVLNPIISQFKAAAPNESAVCLLGSIRDTTLNQDRWLIIQITEAIPAIVDSVNEFNVWFPISSGCENNPKLLGIAHSHTALSSYCSNSTQDALLLFADKRLLFSMVFCANGIAEVLYQDGRRYLAQWAS